MAVAKFMAGMVVIFVAAFSLFWIFDQLQKLADSCQTEPKPICKQLTGFSFSMLIILLIIGGFSLVICSVVYILLAFK